jgi:hypothetical protein
MEGEKIFQLKQTLNYILNILNPQDRLCIITFDTRAKRVTKLLRVSPDNIESVFKVQINSLTAGGGTNITAGMKIAFKVLK